MRSTIDVILAKINRLLAELHRVLRKQLHVAYIDIKAAFDSVDRQAVENTPCHRSSTIPDSAHSGSAHRHKITSSSRQEAFNISSGVRQGCVLAPALFCLAIDWIVSRCSGSLGVTLRETVFTNLNYADDAVLFAQDPGRWQAELKRFDDAAPIMGLHTSWVKTKLQNIGHGPPPQSVDGHLVEVTDNFVYLSSIVDSSGYFSTDILSE